MYPYYRNAYHVQDQRLFLWPLAGAFLGGLIGGGIGGAIGSRPFYGGFGGYPGFGYPGVGFPGGGYPGFGAPYYY